MLDAADRPFIAETASLGSRQTNIKDFFKEVANRLQAHGPAWHRVGVGVCETAVAGGANLVIDDVRAQDNYLACSVATRSELVVLIRDQDEVLGQFDGDGDIFADESHAVR
ncbi:MAG: hypothetical protein JO352_13000 [Chloroflexi bacterium]|nr:hypothetical protein [Chloroflexota bacterium]